MNTALTVILMMAGIAGFAIAQEPGANGDAIPNAHQGSSEKTGEAAQAGPVRTRMEFENDSVRVLRIVIGPHEKIPMHEVSPRLVVWLTNAHLRLTFPDGKSTETEGKAGETTWLNAQRHAGENLGDTPIEFLAIVLKSK